MYQISNEKFGLFVTELRKEKNLTQKDLAEKLYVSDKTVSKWERGLSMPNVVLLIPCLLYTSMMRKTYLKEHRPAMYSLYMLEDRLTEHLNTVDDEAQERMGILVRQMMDRQGITEELKVRDQMEWVRAVNGIRNMAEEIVLNELIYR